MSAHLLMHVLSSRLGQSVGQRLNKHPPERIIRIHLLGAMVGAGGKKSYLVFLS